MVFSIAQLASDAGIPLWLFITIIIWSVAWKGVAWWHAARQGHRIWFIAFFIINTVGILEILYIFLFSKLTLPRLPQSIRSLSSHAPKNNKRRWHIRK